MNAAQVMTCQPVTAGPTMSVRDVAKLLLEHGISAVPVVDASGELLGIVSEGDLVRRRDVDRDDRARGGCRCLRRARTSRRSSWPTFAPATGCCRT